MRKVHQLKRESPQYELCKLDESNRLGLLRSFLIRFLSPSMWQLISSRFSIVRVAVVAALFSLCISSNVGPCFLPLPALENYAAETLQPTTGATASRSHSSRSASYRVPMAQAQKRADRELQAQPLALMPGIHFVPANDTRVFVDISDPDAFFTVALASLPSGRAPPRRLV